MRLGQKVRVRTRRTARGVKRGARTFSDRLSSNIRTSNALLLKRRGSRPPIPKVLGWRYLLLAAMTVVLCAAVLDLPVGAYRSQWPPELILWASRLTDLGKSDWILVPTGMVIVISYAIDWRAYSSRGRLLLAKVLSANAYIFLSVAVSGLIVTLLKRIIGRARPMHFEDLGAFAFKPFSDYSFASFPSGHSTTIGALLAAVAIFFPGLRYPALIIGVWLGFTRVLVGAHYPSDVVAGLAFGAWYAYFSALVFARYGFIFTYDSGGWPVRRRGIDLVRLWRTSR